MSGPQLDIDAIEADLTIRERTGGEQTYYENLDLMRGKRSGTTIGDADRRVRAAVPALCAEVRQLRQALAAVEKLCSDPAYVFDVGVACIRVSDIRAALGAAVTPTPQDEPQQGDECSMCKLGDHVFATSGGACNCLNRGCRCLATADPVTSTPEAAPTVAEKMAVKAAEVAAMSRWSYREALDALMAAAGYFPTPEAATEADERQPQFVPGGRDGRCTRPQWCVCEPFSRSNCRWLAPPAPSGLQRATEQQQ